MTDPLFDREEIKGALAELNDDLRQRGARGEIHLFGGSAILLSFDSRRATRDLDAVWSPDAPILAARDRIARRHGWPSSWLDNQASAYLSANAGPDRVVCTWSHLTVYVSDARHLLAMKVVAGRPAQDAEDIATLVRHLGLTTTGEVLGLTAAHFPQHGLPRRNRRLVKDIMAAAAAGAKLRVASDSGPANPRSPADDDRPARCGRELVRAGGSCGRPAGHDGPCRR